MGEAAVNYPKEVGPVSVGGVGATGPSAVGLITNVLREHARGGTLFEDKKGLFYRCKCGEPTYVETGAPGFAEHVAAAVDAALGGLTREAERRRVCVCRHPKVDHDMYAAQKGCLANSGSHKSCPCTDFKPWHRSRWVSSYSEDEQ